jgi:hypothetical protein
MGKPFEHEAAEIDIGTRRGLEGDLHDATFDGGCVVVAFDDSPPIMSRMTSAPRSPVAFLVAATKSSVL